MKIIIVIYIIIKKRFFINPSTAKAVLLAAISKPHRTNRNALVTFPEYGWATKWHNYCIYIVTQKSEMAVANGDYFFKNLKKTNNSDCMQDCCIIPTALPIVSWSRDSMKHWMKQCIHFGASGSQKSKMAVLKEELLIFLHVYNIAEKFQWQISCFKG